MALAKHGHFGRAAESIGMTQSALSQNIQRVEEFYEVPLFTRERGHISLTAYGDVVVVSAQTALDALQQAERGVRLLRNLETGHLVIGVDGFLASSLVAPALAALLEQHPHLKFTLRTGDWESLEGPLRADDIDIMFGFPPEHPHPEIDVQLVEIPTPLVLCKPSHELADKAVVTLAEAIEYPVVSASVPTWYLRWAQQQMERFKDKTSFTEIMVLDTDNLAVAKHIAKTSHALVPALVGDVRQELESGQLAALQIKNFPTVMNSCVALRSSRQASPAVALLAAAYSEAANGALSRL